MRPFFEKPTEQELTPEELKKVHSRARLMTWTLPRGSWDHVRSIIYNGSNLTLKEITIGITVWNSANQKSVDDRLYRVRNEAGVGPLQTGNFDAALGFETATSQRWQYRLVSAKGTRN